jgi:amidase
MDDLIRMTATAAVARLARGEITPLDLLDAAEARIAATDGAINALPTLCFERARERAQAMMAFPPDRPGRGYLHGLPVAVKDLSDVAGVRTTYGSLAFRDHVPERSDIMVERLEARGALVVAKSNTPEFGAGSQTFNDVFGTTTNPWDTRLTPGGSSGGSAAALAAGQVWLATGSDHGGSIRIPASFTGTVGLRPGVGTVPHGPTRLPFGTLAVNGPMGRTVADVALMLDAMAGFDPRDPLTRPPRSEPFAEAAARPAVPSRVAFSADLGIAPVDPEVRAICEAGARRLADWGAAVEEASIDFSDVVPMYDVIRAVYFSSDRAQFLDTHRDRFKPDLVWNIEQGLKLDAEAIGRAERARGALYHRTAEFFGTYGLLACPAVVVPPFDHRQRFVAEVAGIAFEHYFGWLILTFAITLTACPSMSVPCGTTADGRPVGLQLVAPMGGEATLLAAAAALERSTGLSARVPLDPTPSL